VLETALGSRTESAKAGRSGPHAADLQGRLLRPMSVHLSYSEAVWRKVISFPP
jgi:hypothetical protein